MNNPELEPQIHSASFLITAFSPEQYPPATLPEIAFAGRSNVGKSSLLNVLLDRKRLVKVSREPGRTRSLNFFQADDRAVLVDLPGYGYAKVSRAVRAQWGPMIETYLLRREALAGVALLVDIRRDPEDEERQLIELVQQRGVRLILVATKADQVPAQRILPRLQSIADRLGLKPSWIVPFCKLTRQGRSEIWRRIDTACERWYAARAVQPQER